MQYLIMGKHKGETEEIDRFDTKAEAQKMLAEYKLAFGKAWKLWVKASS